MRTGVCTWDDSCVPLRCLIVDDNVSFLEAAASLLEREGVTVAGVASTIPEALRQAQELHPDVILVDITIRYESGFDLARQLAGTDLGGSAVILISTHAEAEFADLIEEAPVAGFVPKSELSASAIQRLARTLTRGITGRSSAGLSNATPPPTRPSGAGQAGAARTATRRPARAPRPRRPASPPQAPARPPTRRTPAG
jgi:DNA-binding NarL/FixJ family response regulator